MTIVRQLARASTGFVKVPSAADSRLLDRVPALICCLTPEGEPVYFNSRLAEWLGAATIEAAVHPEDAPVVTETLDRSLKAGEPFSISCRLRRRDGAYRWTEGRVEPMRDADGRIVQWYGVVADIEDEVRAQNALRCAQDRLARASQASSLAELSASIAHEVNQPLAAVVANADACRRWLSADPPNIERARITCERIVRDANASSDVINGIRALFKQSTTARALANINEVILEVGRLMSDEIETANVGVKYELDVSVAPMLIDRVQIQQVLVNLIRNATEALGSAPGERSLGIRSLRVADDQVRVEVVDRGRGLDDTERIFEPFFTTKPSGMGMGLAICRSIVEAHDGELWAEKNEPTGTQFIFTLPIRGPEQG